VDEVASVVVEAEEQTEEAEEVDAVAEDVVEDVAEDVEAEVEKVEDEEAKVQLVVPKLSLNDTDSVVCLLQKERMMPLLHKTWLLESVYMVKKESLLKQKLKEKLNTEFGTLSEVSLQQLLLVV
jgi:hypothetical protein